MIWPNHTLHRPNNNTPLKQVERTAARGCTRLQVRAEQENSKNKCVPLIFNNWSLLLIRRRRRRRRRRQWRRSVASYAGISAAFVCTSSSKQIYPVSVQSDFLAGEVSNHLSLSPCFFAIHPWVSSSYYLIWYVLVQFVLVFVHLLEHSRFVLMVSDQFVYWLPSIDYHLSSINECNLQSIKCTGCNTGSKNLLNKAPLPFYSVTYMYQYVINCIQRGNYSIL